MRELPARDRARLSTLGSPRAFTGGDLLITQGDDSDDVHVIESGYVLVTHDEPGRPTVALALRGRGDVVGEIAGWMREPRTASVRALGPVTTRVFAFTDFRGTNGAAAPVLATMSRIFVHKLSGTDRLLRNTRYDSLAATARALHELAVCHGDRSEAPVRIKVPIENSDLGALTGYSRASVERDLNRLRDRGALARGKPFVVLDLAQLAEIGHLEPGP